MAVNDIHVPSEGFETARVPVHVVAVHGFLTLAQAVAVNDRGHVVESSMARPGHRLPDVPLGGLAIAEKDVGPSIEPIQLRRQCQPDTH